MSSNFKSHCATSEKLKKRAPGWAGMEGAEEEWKLGKERKERSGGGYRGREISVSAKVFITNLRQMISVSFS